MMMTMMMTLVVIDNNCSLAFHFFADGILEFWSV